MIDGFCAKAVKIQRAAAEESSMASDDGARFYVRATNTSSVSVYCTVGGRFQWRSQDINRAIVPTANSQQTPAVDEGTVEKQVHSQVEDAKALDGRDE